MAGQVSVKMPKTEICGPGGQTNGGKTYDCCARGLPAQHAYDLVYRHGLDVDESGTRLIMGSTTGTLWFSEDQGDSWSEVSAHLPPIYVTRFVAS